MQTLSFKTIPPHKSHLRYVRVTLQTHEPIGENHTHAFAGFVQHHVETTTGCLRLIVKLSEQILCRFSVSA